MADVRIPDDDLNFEDVVITRVDPFRNGGGWHILHGAIGYGGMPSNSPIVPKPGMVARFYGGAGPGSEVYGLVLDGVPVFYKPAVQRECERAIWSAGYEYERAQIAMEPKLPAPQIAGFEWTEDMREISGFGGGYERTCRAMVSAGCKWWGEHPGADPQFSGFKNVYGIVREDNEDAKALSKAVTNAADGDCTGAMHQAAISHVFGWRKLGSWAAYQNKMRELRAAEGESDG